MTQSFELVVRGEASDETVEKIYRLAPDTSVSVEAGLTHVEVDREAPTLLEAILRAIEDVESIGLTIDRVEPDELVYAAEIAARTERTRGSIDHLIRGVRGPGDFPQPVTHAGTRNPLWRWSEVVEWFARFERREPDADDVERSAVIASVNGALETRRYSRSMSKHLRRQLQKLLA